MKYIGNGIEFKEKSEEDDNTDQTLESFYFEYTEKEKILISGLDFAKFMSTNKKAWKFVKREGFPNKICYLTFIKSYGLDLKPNEYVKQIEIGSRNMGYLFNFQRSEKDIIAYNLHSGLDRNHIIETDKKRVINFEYIKNKYGEDFERGLFRHLKELFKTEEYYCFEYFALFDKFNSIKKEFPIFNINKQIDYFADITRNSEDIFYKPKLNRIVELETITKKEFDREIGFT